MLANTLCVLRINGLTESNGKYGTSWLEVQTMVFGVFIFAVKPPQGLTLEINMAKINSNIQSSCLIWSQVSPTCSKALKKRQIMANTV